MKRRRFTRAPGRHKLSDPSSIVFHTAAGLPLALSVDEYRLALLWLADFGGGPGEEGDAAWAGLAAATTFVIDGEAKLALIQERVRPLAGHLAPLAQRITAMDLLTARYWFRNSACETTARKPDVDTANQEETS